jgi:superfamily II DNA or RNA helicase
VQWLRTGRGAHGEDPLEPLEVERSLQGSFEFIEESEDPEGSAGLRAPQLGALHAILAQRTIDSHQPITIVLPTGTGKTETMLAAYAYAPQRTVIVVPSDSLRTQIAGKFLTLGILPAIEAVTGQFRTPVVGILRSRLETAEDCAELLSKCNVLVGTAAALSRCSPEAVAELARGCDQLFVDEAHHVAARTWRTLAEAFAERSVVQFTATPFREDGQPLGGKIAYAYPLRLAQQREYFAPINYTAVSAIGDVDRSLAEAAVRQLESDLAADLDHVLMARVNSIPRAESILEIYEEIAADHGPIRIDSRLSATRQRDAQARLTERTSRVVVCVDMLGEGFDLPALKIAAVHDPHKSLAVTLQFVGRFARVGGVELGEASVFVPRQVGGTDDRLRKLYGEDADWNDLIRDLTTAEVEREQARNDFESRFGSVSPEVALKSLRPKMSTVVFRSESPEWNPYSVYQLFPEIELLTKQVAVNEADHVLWFVTAEHTPVRWGDFSSISEVVHHLYIVHADLANGLLYINSSNNESVHEDLAQLIGGQQMSLLRGTVVYRVLHDIERRVPTNIGLLDTVNRNRRFSMLTGADVLEGFDATAAQKSKTNIFAHGYRDGRRVTFGASQKGRVWSHLVAPSLLDWVKWAQAVGATLTDESISIESVMSGFIIPKAAVVRPDLVPLGVEWPAHLIGTNSEGRQVSANGIAHPLIDVTLAITAWDTEDPIHFEVRSDDWAIAYSMTFSDGGPEITADGADAEITSARGWTSLASFMNSQGLTVYFEQEALVSPLGYFLQPDRSRPRFPRDDLEPVSWDGTNIRAESQGPDRDATSVQFRAIELLRAEAEWDIVIDDDGPGETADIVLLKVDDGALRVVLCHCKYSGGDSPGSRVGDLYEVCGQSQKSYKARSEIELILKKLIRREQHRHAANRPGLIVGDLDGLLDVLDRVHVLDVALTVVIAQPGLSKGQMSIPQAELLACTAHYLSDTYGSRLRVLCSE